MSKDNSSFFKQKNEWSKIKDKLLACYLEPYFQKLLITNKPIFYVDCFAGKGKFDDGNPGSPRIALELRDRCLEKSCIINKKTAIESCFIDLNYAVELKTNIADYNNGYGNPIIINGKYEDNIEKLLSEKKGYNVFLYIDPYGIKALDSNIFEKFETFELNTFEMLINFNSFGFFRDACRVMRVDYKNDELLSDLSQLVEYEPTIVMPESKQSSEMLSIIADGEYWKDIVTDYNNKKIDGLKAEKMLSREYKQRLRKRYTYVLDMPICLKSGNQPKYRMVHVCNHEDGCYLMAQNMLKRKDELFINLQREGQMSIFDNLCEIRSTIEGEYINIRIIKEKLKDFLEQYSDKIGITKLIAAFYTEYGLLCDIKMIHEALIKLQDEGLIEIIREPKLTEKSNMPTRFWDEKGNQKVYIRRR